MGRAIAAGGHGIVHGHAELLGVGSVEPALQGVEGALAIDWPLADASLSAKDAAAPLLAEIAPERLPQYLA